MATEQPLRARRSPLRRVVSLLVRVAVAVVVASFAVVSASPAHAAPYVAPTRSVAQIERAIEKSNAGIAPAGRRALAKLLIDVARDHNFDPLMGWAIIDHESRWRSDAVGPDGEDIGLAQIRYTQTAECREDRDSPECLARRTALMDPVHNITMMGSAISAWRELCTKMTGKAPDIKNWLAGYGGYSKPGQYVYCGLKRVRGAKGWRWQQLATPKPITDVIESRQAMIHELSRKPGRAPRATAKKTPEKTAPPAPKPEKASPAKGTPTKPSKAAPAKPSKASPAKPTPSKPKPGRASQPHK